MVARVYTAYYRRRATYASFTAPFTIFWIPYACFFSAATILQRSVYILTSFGVVPGRFTLATNT